MALVAFDMLAFFPKPTGAGFPFSGALCSAQPQVLPRIGFAHHWQAVGSTVFERKR